MNKKFIALLLLATPLIMNAQGAFDVLNMSQTELRGTSRFMAMGGAYTAVGGDISTLNQNPGGVGIYRNSDVAATISLDFNDSKADGLNKRSNTRFNFNSTAKSSRTSTGDSAITASTTSTATIPVAGTASARRLPTMWPA